MVKVAELWDRLTWLRGRSLSLLRTTSWTLTQVGLEVSKVRVTFRKSFVLSRTRDDFGQNPGHGNPLSHRKFKEGLAADYVGYYLEYDRHVTGISIKRAGSCIGTLEQNGWMVQAGHLWNTGRLSFIARVVG